MEIVPFKEAVAAVAEKKPLPTSLSSAELAKVDAQIRERAIFSARVANARLLQEIRDHIKKAIEHGHSTDTARVLIQDLIHKISYKAPEGKEGTISDLSSDARVRLIVETQVAMAHGYGRWKQGQTKSILEMWPAQEFYRAEERVEPRNWPERWAAAGGNFYAGHSDYPQGRMIALVNDPIWKKVSAFGLPYAPFDFNSGMGTRPITADEAEKLGIEVYDSDTDPVEHDFKHDEDSDVLTLDPDIKKQLLTSLGDDYKITKTGVLKLANSIRVKSYTEVRKGKQVQVREYERKGEKRAMEAPGDKWVAIKRVGGTMKAIGNPKTGRKRMRLVGSTWEVKGKIPKHLMQMTKKKGLQQIPVPPTWDKAEVNLSPHGKYIVRGVDEFGRTQSVRNPKFAEQQDAEKWQRVDKLRPKLDALKEKLWDESGYDDVDGDCAAAMMLQIDTGLRAGSSGDTQLGQKKSFGLCQLLTKHVHVTGKKGSGEKMKADVTLQFSGKGGKEVSISVENQYVKRDLVARKEDQKPNDLLFGISYNDYLSYQNEVNKGAKTHDYRTLLACDLAKKEVFWQIKQHGLAKDDKQFRKMQLAAAKVISERLGNQPSQVIKSYVNPQIWEALKQH